MIDAEQLVLRAANTPITTAAWLNDQGQETYGDPVKSTKMRITFSDNRKATISRAELDRVEVPFETLWDHQAQDC